MTEPPVRLQRAVEFRDPLFFYLVTGFTVRWIGTAASAGPSAVVIWLMACLAFYVPRSCSPSWRSRPGTRTKAALCLEHAGLQ